MLKNLSKLKIEKRLSKSFTLVSLITSIAAVIGLIALIITTTQYSNALKNYGFTQGDIGKALVTFADTRAATRGIIAYQQKDLIDSTKTIHDTKKQKFLDYMTTVEETMTSDEEKAAYQEAETQLEKYWTLEDKVIKAGATIDAESSIEAQKTESGDLNELYDEVYAQLLPQEKLEHLKNVRKNHGAVMFVGDGINDAPVLAGADVGAAMGSGADAAIEAADVVFMNSSVEAIPQSIAIAKKTGSIAIQNVVFALVIKAIVMILGFLGFANMWLAVFADTGVAMLCVLNSIRAMHVKTK